MEKQYHVLLVEDNPGDADFLQEMLAANPVIPFDITWEARLKNALEQLEESAFDLVVLDLGLPDSNGLETLCEVRNHAPEIAIVVMTGLNDEQTGVRAVQEGAQDYLVKGQLEGYLLSRFLLYAVERKKNEQKIAHLNQVLRIIRNVNQLIVKEHDCDSLLAKTCATLTGMRGYRHAWIVLFDQARRVTASFQSGLNSQFAAFIEQMTDGQLNRCATQALAQTEVVIIEDPEHQCAGCLLCRTISDMRAMTARLEHDGTVYGLLSVAIPWAFLDDGEETSLFAEIAGDIAFALHGFEVEARRQHAENALKEYSERLEHMVAERTQELRDAQEQLVQREKLAVLGQLAGSVAHELRNPLGVISNAIYYLRMILNQPDGTIREYLDLMMGEVRNAEKIVGDLLEFARVRKVDKLHTDIADVVAHIFEQYPPPEGITTQIDMAENLPSVYVDPIQIEQILVNLVVNAYQSMMSGGTLRIRSVVEPDALGVEISDTGCGIAPDNMAKLFEPLFTTKMRGIGLGLAVCKNLTEANAGTITVTSEEGQGSTFTIFLPVGEELKNGRTEG